MRCYYFAILYFSTSVAYPQQPDNSTPAAKTARAVPSALPAGIRVNYVRTWSPNQMTNDPVAVMAASDVGAVAMSTVYFDGLGRLIQTVDKGLSPLTRKDLVTPMEYDAFGRSPIQYLTYASATSNGGFKRNPFSEQKAFYDLLLTKASNNKEDIYYAETRFESSPLNRIDKAMPPGNNWTGSGRGETYQYLVNTLADEVRRWNLVTTIYGNIPVSSLLPQGTYAAGELQKILTIDENGKQAISFIDKDQRTVLKKIQISPTPSAGHTGWLCTYYVYDPLGNLRYAIPPKAVDALPLSSWALSTAMSQSLCFRYEYDARGRMIIKKLPGVDLVEMVYDQRGRLVLSRDGNLRAAGGKWLATLYDDLNRPVMTGIFSSTRTHNELIADQNLQSGMSSISPVMLDPLTYTYYDNYTYPGAKPAASAYFTKPQAGASTYPEAIVVNMQAKGLVTGTKVRVLETSQYLVTTTYYDIKGRPVQILSDNHNNGLDISTNLYDFSGKLLSSYQCLSNPPAGAAGTIRLLTNNTYDHAGRLVKISKLLNDNVLYKRDIATNIYDSLGRLRRKEFRGASGNLVESMDYTYNIQGWLKGINPGYLKGAENRYFGEELHYDAGFTNKEYGGNIAGVTWKGMKNKSVNAYGYIYDASGRLMKANFTQATGTVSWGKNGHNYDVWMGDGINYNTAYDANGNILRMQQWGAKGTSTNTKVDDLIYVLYDSTGLTASNRLYRVTDAVNDPATTLGDFSDRNSAATCDYTYDRNGNVSRDENKTISTIRYNHLNLPTSISVSGKGTIVFRYDATGRKLSKIVTDNTVSPAKTTKTDYLGPAIFERNLLQTVSHEEGRIRPITTGGFTYDYFLKDHLGNIRMVVAETPPPQQVYVASMEAEKSIAENSLFSNIEATRAGKPPGYPNDPQNITNRFVAHLNGNDPNKRIGPSLVLKVQTGDTIRLGARAFYKSLAPGEPSKPGIQAAEMAAALITAFGSPSKVVPGTHNAGVPLNAPFRNGFASNGWQRLKEKETKNSATIYRPKAYLNFVLFDEQFNLVEASSGVRQVSAQPDQLQTLAADNLVMGKAGFLYVYTSNETQQDVFFDNITLILAGTPVLEETHYYPFGLAIAGLSDRQLIAKENPYKYNGKELNTNEFAPGWGLAWYDYGARMYDPQLGRWHVIDPLADLMRRHSPYNYTFNNPVRFIDPDGMAPGDGFLSRFKKASAATGRQLIFAHLGAINAFVSNNTLGIGRTEIDQTGLIGGDAIAFQFGQKLGDAASTVTGAGEVTAAASGEIVGIGMATPVAIPLAAHGAITSAVSLKNLFTPIKFIENGKNDTNTSTSSLPETNSKNNTKNTGYRRQNRIPNIGEPNSTASNPSGTTIKKYGPDGRVQKEFNKGHSATSTPKNESSDHVHDYKPAPLNPNGGGTRFPGRPIKPREWAEFGLRQ